MRHLDDGSWHYAVFDYQNNEMTSGTAPILGSAQQAVEDWDAWVVTVDEDPSRGWPDDDD